MADRNAARRYAKAFLELAIEQGVVDRLYSDLDRVAEVVRASNGELIRALSNPVFTLEERHKVLAAVLPKLGLHALTRNLILLVLDKGRFATLPDIADVFGEMADERANRARVIVETAEPMSRELEAEVRAALARVTGKEVKLATVVKPELIGGIVARIGSRVYDASIRARLENLRTKLIHSQIPAEA